MTRDPSSEAGASLLEQISGPRPIVAIELRPPRLSLSSAESREAWIDANHALRRLSESRTIVFVTDNAVGSSEEENLQHLVANLGPEGDRQRMVPFLTCKHTLDHCLWYAQRAAQSGYRALVVLGGDTHDGVPRCVEHAYELRRLLREKVPGLVLGGWANPHRDPDRQAAYIAESSYEADFFLTQVVSHFDPAPAERFLEALERRRVALPGFFGVFYYRSARRRTLRELSRFLPVPSEGLARAFASGATADEICAETIRTLGALGARRFYVSNVPTADAHRVAARLRGLLEA